MTMSKKTLLISLALVLILLIGFIVLTQVVKVEDNKADYELEQEFGFGADSILQYENTHGGFLGDGETVISFIPSEEAVKYINENWYNEITDKEIENFLKNTGIMENFGIPKIETGTLFYCRNRSNADYISNFVFAMYDGTDNIVYYYRYDS